MLQEKHIIGFHGENEQSMNYRPTNKKSGRIGTFQDGAHV
jgi:hypothetical protein